MLPGLGTRGVRGCAVPSAIVQEDRRCTRHNSRAQTQLHHAFRVLETLIYRCYSAPRAKKYRSKRQQSTVGRSTIAFQLAHIDQPCLQYQKTNQL